MIIERISFILQHSADPLEAESELSKETVWGVCGCGRKATSRSQRFCVPDAKETKSRCPCVLYKKQCETKCSAWTAKTAWKNTTKSQVVAESPTKILNYKERLESLAQMWMVRDEQNVAAIRMDKLVSVSVHARIVEMKMAKEKRTVCARV